MLQLLFLPLATRTVGSINVNTAARRASAVGYVGCRLK